jgi:hypothetical protein
MVQPRNKRKRLSSPDRPPVTRWRPRRRARSKKNYAIVAKTDIVGNIDGELAGELTGDLARDPYLAKYLVATIS